MRLRIKVTVLKRNPVKPGGYTSPAAATPRPSRSRAVSFRGLNEFAKSQLLQNEIIENALRKQVKLLPNNKL